MSSPIVLTRDGSLTLRSRRYGQTFHSEYGAKTEALHVYLEGGLIRQTLKANGRVHILEVGFGAGLNFILTAALARQLGGQLRYTALDQRIPHADTLEALRYGATASMPDVWEAFLAWCRTYQSTVPDGRYSLTPAAHCHLQLIIGDATDAKLPVNRVDTIYLDAFDPQCNPVLWTEPFLAALYNCAAPGGRLVTYSAAGAVRRGLSKAGFQVERRPGPPGKRHCLRGRKPS